MLREPLVAECGERGNLACSSPVSPMLAVACVRGSVECLLVTGLGEVGSEALTAGVFSLRF